MGIPATLCSTLGVADFIRVPMPAARTIAAPIAQRHAPFTVFVAFCAPAAARITGPDAAVK
jgi:hypothetical protein